MRTLPIPFACLALLCACSAPPRPLSPDGAARNPVNTPQSIDRYLMQLAAQPQRRTPDCDSRITALEHEVSQLRQQREQTKTLTAPAVFAPASRALIIDGVTIEQLPQGLRFSMPQPYGKAMCDVDPALRQMLLRAAITSEHIEIRGHTDAKVADPANRRLAGRRAACARHLLLAGGVPATRLHSSHLAAGGFIADNHSEEGRARNRRIDIEIHGPQPAALQQLEQLEQLKRSTTP